MDFGLFSGTVKTSWHEFFPQLLVANSDGTGLVQPINNGTPLRNLGRWTYLDPNTIFGEVHMSHSYFHPSLGGNEGTGAFYVIELPKKAKRWGGDESITAPYVIGGGYGNKVLQTPALEMLGTATLADHRLFNIKGQADRFLQVYFPFYEFAYNATWTAGASSVTFPHYSDSTPDPTDLEYQLSSAPGSNYYTNIVGNVRSGSGITTTANRYIGPTNVVQSWSTSATGVGSYIVLPGNGLTFTFDSFGISQDTASGSGITRNWYVQKNGVDQTLATTISGTSQTSNSDTTHSFTAVSGDTIAIHTTASATTANTGAVRWTLRAACTTNHNISASGGSQATVSNSVTSYSSVQGFFNNSTISNIRQVMPTSGTFQNSQCILTGSPGGTASYQFTLLKNGVATAHTFTITGAATTGGDTTHPISYSQYDTLCWEIVPSGTPTARGHFTSLDFVADTPGESLHMYAGSANLANSAVRYAPLSQEASIATTATESDASVITQTSVMSKLTARTTIAPSSGKSWTFKDYKNAAGVGSLSTVIADTNTQNADNTNSTTYAFGDTASFQITPAGTPTSTDGQISMVSYMAPTTPNLDTILVSTSSTLGTLTLASGNIGSANVTVHYKWRIEPTAAVDGSWAYSPKIPWVWSLVQGHYVQFIYELDN